MQYILTEDEYKELLDKRMERNQAAEEALQKFCTRVANEMPVKFWDNEEAKPWGCMLDKEYEWCCDECPAQDFCPYPHKEWSK